MKLVENIIFFVFLLFILVIIVLLLVRLSVVLNDLVKCSVILLCILKWLIIILMVCFLCKLRGGGLDRLYILLLICVWIKFWVDRFCSVLMCLFFCFLIIGVSSINLLFLGIVNILLIIWLIVCVFSGILWLG